MIKKTLLILGLIASFTYSNACTNFLAGKAATLDGSTLISYSADSYFLFGALYHYPAATHAPGTLLDIYEWDTGKYLGKIKQAEKTYSVIGNMNEHQLAIAETT
ncbi:MAG: C69 family dipeptidase, partial [Paludibacter sp.]|nr:C69 family dipeptidase [Paludibacter sp.]